MPDLVTPSERSHILDLLLFQDLKSFAAEVRVGAEGNGGKFNYIGPILISLKTDLAESQVIMTDLVELQVLMT